eukprot:4324399-Amphidinium_carterae.2
MEFFEGVPGFDSFASPLLAFEEEDPASRSKSKGQKKDASASESAGGRNPVKKWYFVGSDERDSATRSEESAGDAPAEAIAPPISARFAALTLPSMLCEFLFLSLIVVILSWIPGSRRSRRSCPSAEKLQGVNECYAWEGDDLCQSKGARLNSSSSEATWTGGAKRRERPSHHAKQISDKHLSSVRVGILLSEIPCPWVAFGCGITGINMSCNTVGCSSLAFYIMVCCEMSLVQHKHSGVFALGSSTVFRLVSLSLSKALPLLVCAGVSIIMEVQNGRITWSAADIRSRALAGICNDKNWHGEAEVGCMLQATHDLGVQGLWLHKQLALRVAESMEVVLRDGPARAVKQPLGQSRCKRNRLH